MTRDSCYGPIAVASRRDLLRLMGGALGAAGLSPFFPLAGCSPSRSPARMPNLLLIMTDDQGYQDLGCYGSPDIATPRIDAMAAAGVRFTSFYAAAQCTAARVALMTGCHAPRVGDLKRTGAGTRAGLHDDELTLAELARGQGHATHLVGKWHLGMDPIFSPLRHGFDSYFGLLTSNGQHPPLMRDQEVVEQDPDQSTLTERYTAEAQGILRRAGDRPFLLFVSHLMPHVPLAVSDRFRGRSRRGLYGDAVQCIDWSTGELLDTLGEAGLADDTLVIFCSDNGPWLIKGDRGGSAAPLRGGKGQAYEGGVRVPCIMRWPGRIPAGRECREVCGLLDVMPTFARLCGAELPADRVIDGHDIWPLIQGAPGAVSPHADYPFFRGSELVALRRGRWKYHVAAGSLLPDGALYDLDADLGEQTNLVHRHAELARDMREEIARFSAELERTRRPPGVAPPA